MAGFVLIHGSWHGGWCFDLLAEELTRAIDPQTVRQRVLNSVTLIGENVRNQCFKLDFT